MSEPSSPRPWYREPMMLLVLGLPAVAVIASLITLWIAIANRDSIVTEATPRDNAPRHSLPAKRGG